MFSPEEREALLARLVAAAASDNDVVGAALLGSAARGELDRWSDVDLALRLAPGATPEGVAEAWTARVAETERVVDHLDLRASGALYRVLLLGSTLQVDLSFWPHDQPLADGAPVEVLLGDVPVAPARASAPADGSRTAVRMGWLYALHVRSALARGRPWQASWMLDQLRDVVVGLWCRAAGLPPEQGRGVDRLPGGRLAELAASRPRGVEPDDLWSGFEVLTGLLLAEAARQDVDVPADLRRVVTELARRPAVG